MNAWQRCAIQNFTLSEYEQARPMFRHDTAAGSLVLTARAGWG